MQIINKKIGETPLEALKRFRDKNPTYADVRLSYAGRLDPMASGKLMILEGEENDRRAEFLGLDKSYEFEILFGVSTDTFDLLGLVTEIADTVPTVDTAELQHVCDEFYGTQMMSYPPYSAMTVAREGKQIPLWQLARNEDLPDNLPKKEVEVFKIKAGEVRNVSADYINDYINNYINKVSGDFRQEEICERWQEVLMASRGLDFQIAKAEVSASSGLYVRRLVEQIGRRMGIPTTTFSIHRIKVGEY